MRVFEIVELGIERPPLTAHYLAEHGRKELTFSVLDVYKKD